MQILSVNTIFFTIIGYPMSYIEFVGTILYLWSVWLIAKRKILTWPVGIVSVILYMVLFYQIQLYSDTFEQIYYLFACGYGWWHWKNAPQDNGQITDITYSSWPFILLAIGITVILTLCDGYFMSRIHIIFPKLFPERASFPYIDAFTTIMSFTAMWLMARKKIESWVYWIIVDIIGIGLYYVKNVKFIALLYVVLLILACKGLYEWMRAHQSKTIE